MAGNYTNIIDKLHLIDAEIVKNQEKINDLVIEKEQYIALLRVNQELDDLEKFFEERSIILLSQINDITQNLENYKSTTDQLLRNNENYCQRCEKIIYLNQVEVICSGMCNNHFHVNCVNLREKLNKLCLKIDQIEFVCINCNFNTDTLKINMTNQMKLQSGKMKEESEKKEKSDLIPVNTASSTEYEDLKKNGVLLDKNNKKSNESIVNSSMLIEPGLDQMQEIDKNYNDCNSSKVVDESNKIIELRKVNSKLMESKQLTKGLYVGNVDKNINTDHFTRIVKLIIGSEKNVMIYRLQNKNNYCNAFYIQCNISDQLKLLNSQIGESIIIRPFIGDFNVDLKSDLGMKKSRYFTNSKKKKNDTEKRNINKNGSELNKDKTTDTNNLPGVKSKNDVDNKFEKENSTEKNIHQDDTKINLPIDWVENTSVEVEKEKTKLIKKEKNEKKTNDK